MRVTSGKARHKSKKRLFKEARGNRGGRSKLLRTVKETVVRSRAYAYRDRRNRKRDFRALWITRVKAGCMQHGIQYSRFIHGLKLSGVELNRKMHFLQATPTGWLAQYPRYLEAMQLRWGKLSGGLARDRREMDRLVPLWRECRELWSYFPSSLDRPPEVEAYRWLFEEHRVLTFAQSLGTAGDASASRLSEARGLAREAMEKRGVRLQTA